MKVIESGLQEGGRSRNHRHTKKSPQVEQNCPVAERGMDPVEGRSGDRRPSDKIRPVSPQHGRKHRESFEAKAGRILLGPEGVYLRKATSSMGGSEARV